MNRVAFLGLGLRKRVMRGLRPCHGQKQARFPFQAFLQIRQQDLGPKMNSPKSRIVPERNSPKSRVPIKHSTHCILENNKKYRTRHQQTQSIEISRNQTDDIFMLCEVNFSYFFPEFLNNVSKSVIIS